jgi:pimeloyl-ACP methyl ester carboxylesterase
MRIHFGLLSAFVLAASALAPAQSIPGCTLVTGPSHYLFCPIPNAPAAPLVIYSHGYVDPALPVGIPWNQFVLSDGTPIPVLINKLGFAFAATSYPVNGLATVPAIADTLALLNAYKSFGGGQNPAKVYITGVSEGALIATKLLETYPGKFNAGMALCGPIGDFRRQINYMGDFRAVYDFYFRDDLPGSAIWIPSTAEPWSAYEAKIRSRAVTDPVRFKQPYNVLDVPVDPADFAKSAVDILWYSYHATNNANDVLFGNPFDNKWRWYSGSNNDFALNFGIERFAATGSALANIQKDHQTTGRLSRPMVTMHTTGDPVAPYWHASLYGLKVLTAGSLGNYVHLPVFRYGHCAFQPAEIVFGFALMVGKSGGALNAAEDVLTTDEDRAAYRELHRRIPAAEK